MILAKHGNTFFGKLSHSVIVKFNCLNSSFVYPLNVKCFFVVNKLAFLSKREMDPAMGLVPAVDETGVPWLMWLPRNSQNSMPVKFDGIRIVVFHYFDQHLNELTKWIEMIDKIASEYAGRIHFAAQDISKIQNFFKALSREVAIVRILPLGSMVWTMMDVNTLCICSLVTNT